jgi:autoinducer 2 (AI-2) kinase
MTANYILVIDAGTSGVHCLIIDFKGHIISISHRDWVYQSPDDIAPLGKEFAPDAFWHIICNCIRQLLKNSGISPEDIVSISTTGQREGVVFLDKEGKELYAGPNLDLRALTEGISIDNEYSNEICAITGHLPSFLFVPAKLRWFETNRLEIYSKIATVLTINEWIIYRLCGERVSEVCGASELGLIDIRERKWSGRLQDLLALPRGIYPQLVPAGSQVGKLTSQASAEMGISPGIMVVQGAPDTHCGLLGMEVKERGQVGIIAGWSAPVQMVTDEPIFDPENRIWSSCHLLVDKWILESSTGEAGNAFDWLRENIFGQDESFKDMAFDLMDQLALSVPPGADGVLAFIGPAVMDMSHLALRYGGFLFPVPLSATNIQRAHLVRAALENFCFAIKANCLQLEAISGLKIEEVRLGGGLAKSQCLTKILPAVLDLPTYIPEITEVSALGAAMCAAVGAGVYSSLGEAMSAMKPQMKVIAPERLSALEYEEYYQRWISTAKSLGKLSEEM